MTEPVKRSRKPRQNPKPLAWMPDFLTELKKNGVVRQAARTAGIALATAYEARGRHPAFAKAWDKALAAAQEGGGRVGELCAPVTAKVPAKPASAHWRIDFFEALAETSCVTAAAARARMPTRTVYKLRREDGDFAARWLAALHEGYDNLEMELLGHLRASQQPKRKMDVGASLRLLAAHRDTVERRRSLTEDEDEQEVLDSIDRFIDEMRERRAANEAILAETEAEEETGTQTEKETDNDAQ